MTTRRASALVALSWTVSLVVAPEATAQESPPTTEETSPPSSPPREVARVDVSSLLERARDAEARGEVEIALAAYREVVAVAPTSRFALQAERRLAWLEPRAGDPAALGLLLAYRSRRTRDLAAVEGLEAAALAMGPGPVRREALMTVAGELDALAAAAPGGGLVGRAEDAYRRALAEPDLAAAERAQLVAGYAGLLGREGRTAEALLVLDEAGHGRGGLRSRLELERIDGWARPLALSVLALLAAAAIVLVGRAIRAGRTRELLEGRAWAAPLVATVYGAAGPYVLGAWYSEEAGHLTGVLSLGLGGALFGAAVIGRCLSVQESPRGASRAAMTLAAIAPIAVGYLSIYGAADGPLAH